MALPRTAYGPYLHDNTGFTPQGSGAFVTGSFTPPNSSLLVVIVLCGIDDASHGDTNYVVTGGGLSWTKVANNRVATWSTDGGVLQFWYAAVATGASMQVTVTHTSEGSYAFAVFPYAYEGYNTSTPVGGKASGDGTGTTNSLTLDATPEATSDVLAALMIVGANADASDATVAPGSSFTELAESNSADSFARWQRQARTSSTSTAVSWTTATTASSGYERRLYGAIEIKAASEEAALDGDLQAQAAAIDGVVSAEVVVSGSLEAQAATVAGAVSVIIAIDGDLQSQASSIDGSVLQITHADGSLQAQNSQIAGAISVIVAIDGDLEAQISNIDGLVEVLLAIDGDLEAQDAQIDGSISTELLRPPKNTFVKRAGWGRSARFWVERDR